MSQDKRSRISTRQQSKPLEYPTHRSRLVLLQPDLYNNIFTVDDKSNFILFIITEGAKPAAEITSNLAKLPDLGK
jgi:hypothetical protein